MRFYELFPTFRTSKGITLFVTAHEGVNKKIIVIQAADSSRKRHGAIMVPLSKIQQADNDAAFDELWRYLRNQLIEAVEAGVTVGVI